MKTVYHAAHLFDAELMRQLLAMEGIAAQVQGGWLTGALGDLPVAGLVRVCVADADEAAALAFVAAHEARTVPGDERGE